ncbi:DNA double-strand break repair nuclease NurA [Halovenus sp. WSH3]|uniref:DNA double-strand break repair nuclease NurA n=1 Tax=Halovenus carboxidivorans TaxID=2692199 RepID=A0A6B0SYK9_9EURY|nr:DNA double-strand break repair nuclease NurA [Halovenus carboxidivorans]MXR50858.1 DNA double-strand break repair nuclease NurA [Halovenus carboxidivorans]
MTLDPVHVDGIADLASRVKTAVDDTDQTELAERAFSEFLDPLYDADGSVVLEPLDEHGKRKVPIADVALEEPPFPTQHGLDAGTINPTTFKNGLVIDVSQAAMAAVPSDVDLHRARTIVMTVHTNDTAAAFEETDWRMVDEGYARRRILRAPRVDRHEQVVVHALALYLAESEHALEQSEVVDDLLVLDGPIYPTGLLKWVERDPELERLIIEREEFTDVIANYLELVETFVQRETPLVGFVKNSASKAITRELRRKTGAPWVNDQALFRRVLERPDENGDPQTDALTFTGWFRSRVGTDGVLADGRIELDKERTLDDDDYEVTFFVIYDPRDDLIYRAEAPYAFTRDEQLRAELTTQFLGAVARERGPPLSVGKADELARIDRQGKETIRRRIEHTFETGQQTDYNDKRWGPAERLDL